MNTEKMIFFTSEFKLFNAVVCYGEPVSFVTAGCCSDNRFTRFVTFVSPTPSNNVAVCDRQNISLVLLINGHFHFVEIKQLAGIT